MPPGFGFLVPPGRDSLLLACTFMDQKFTDRVPQGGRQVRAFFGGKAAERLMRCGNDEIASVARLELAQDSWTAAGAGDHGGAALAAQSCRSMRWGIWSG